jgi:hypothetical protein
MSLRVLTDSNIIRLGANFPPASQNTRLEDYDKFYGLYMGTHSDVYQSIIANIEPTRRGNVWICINLPRIISNVWADMLFGEPPLFTSENKAQQSFLDVITKDGSIFGHLHSMAVDTSRYGDGIMRIITDEENGKPELMVQPPQYWYPVVTPRNIKKVVTHIFASRWQEEDDSTGTFGNWHLTADIMRKEILLPPTGQIILPVKTVTITGGQYLLTGITGGIVRQEFFDPVINTGLQEFPVIHVSNFDSSDSLFGLSDLETVDSVLSEIENRYSQISTILDKHASPNIQGPSHLIVVDENNVAHVDMTDSFFGMDADDKPITYITWDGQLAAAYEEIKSMWEFLIRTAEISPALFGGEFGRAESGSAMKRLLLQTIVKVNRLRLSFDPAIKKILKLYSQVALANNVEGAALLDSVDIQWRDGLPQDALEEVQADTMAVSGGISSVEAAVSRAWNLSGKALVSELDSIGKDKEKKAELAPPSPFGGKPTVNAIKGTLKEKPANPSGKNV